jgi:RimJ/RimL family protein N-acetyltransferase
MKFELRSLRQSDAGSLAKHANNQKIANNLTDVFPYPYLLQNAVDFIALKQTEEPLKVFAIVINNEAVGVISIHPQTGIYEITAELGYWLSEQYWGQGIMSEVVSKTINYTFNTFEKVIKIYAKVYDFNIASAKVIEKNNFIKEAVLKKAAVKNGKIIDLIYYAIFKE